MGNDSWVKMAGVFTILAAIAAILVVPEVRKFLALDSQLQTQPQPSNIGSPPSNRQEINKVITVDSHSATWTSSGVQVKRGDVIKVEASGTIDHGRPKCGPDGNPDIAPYGDAVMPTARYGALIAKVGASEPFLIGSNYQTTASLSGEMQFLINDTPGAYYDNSGYFQVRITVVRNQ